MRLVIATAALLFGAAMLLPAATAQCRHSPRSPRARAPPSASASVEPSASVVPSAAPSEPCMMVDPDLPECHDAEVFLRVNSAEPVREWAIDVTGGVPHDDVLVPEPELGRPLDPDDARRVGHRRDDRDPAGWRAVRSTAPASTSATRCRFDVLVPPGRLVLEVVRGGGYQCWYRSNLQVVPAADGPGDGYAGRRPGRPVVGWLAPRAGIDGRGDRCKPADRRPGSARWYRGVARMGAKRRQMRLEFATVALLLGAAMLLPAATTPTASAAGRPAERRPEPRASHRVSPRASRRARAPNRLGQRP